MIDTNVTTCSPNHHRKVFCNLLSHPVKFHANLSFFTSFHFERLEHRSSFVKCFCIEFKFLNCECVRSDTSRRTIYWLRSCFSSTLKRVTSLLPNRSRDNNILITLRTKCEFMQSAISTTSTVLLCFLIVFVI